MGAAPVVGDLGKARHEMRWQCVNEVHLRWELLLKLLQGNCTTPDIICKCFMHISISSITIYMFYRLFLPETPKVQYNFGSRLHDKLLIPKTADLSKLTIIRLLYKDCY